MLTVTPHVAPEEDHEGPSGTTYNTVKTDPLQPGHGGGNNMEDLQGQHTIVKTDPLQPGHGGGGGGGNNIEDLQRQHAIQSRQTPYNQAMEGVTT